MIMITALHAPPGRLDQHEQGFVAKVREYGWANTAVFAEADKRGFSYTTGFCVNAGHPELIMFGMKDKIAHDIFWGAFREAKAGTPLLIGERTNQLFANLPAYALPVAKRFYPDYLGWSRWFYGNDDFPCLQIVWPDREGLFPWETGFDAAFANDQPDLTEHGWQARP